MTNQGNDVHAGRDGGDTDAVTTSIDRRLKRMVLRPLIGHVQSQFHRPRGLGGVVAGQIMSQRASNVARNLWLIDLLELEPHHRVLEIGPGPGVALEAAATRVTEGELVALDHSAIMLRRAAARNRDLLDQRRLQLIEGSAERLPTGLGDFDRIYAMNVWQFWEDQEAAIASLASLLRPCGRLAIGYQPRHRGSTSADADAARRYLSDQFTDASLVDVTDQTLDLEPPVCSVVGRRPAR